MQMVRDAPVYDMVGSWSEMLAVDFWEGRQETPYGLDERLRDDIVSLMCRKRHH